MGDRLNLMGLVVFTNTYKRPCFWLLEIASYIKVFLTVLQTDTSSWVEYTKALGITILKELGKITL